jgi:hypothetical protein
MKTHTPSMPKTLCLIACISAAALQAVAQEVSNEPQLPRVESAPAFGTFWPVQMPIPYPFDPYFGQLPIYEVAPGLYLIDDSQVSFSMRAPYPGGGGGGGGGTNCICNSLTNFTVDYLYSTNGLMLGIAQTTNPWIALTIQTTTTNATCDVFGSTNMADLALPSLGRTN